jgi:hypothetical protein
MEDCYEHGHELRALAMRVAALEDNVAFLEQWCEEQQDILDRAAGPIGYDYEREPEPRKLRVVDLRDGVDAGDDDAEPAEVDTVVAVVETEHDRLVGQIHARLNRLRTRLALSVAPPAEPPDAAPAPRPAPRRLSEKQAGRTAP